MAADRMRAAGVEPLEPYPGSDNPWLGRCLICDREVTPSLSNVRARRGACAYCSKRKVDPDTAVSVMRDHGLEPQVPYPGARIPWLCKCMNCKRSVSPTWGAVSTKDAGCKWCTYKLKAAALLLDNGEATALMIENSLTPLEPYPGYNRSWKCKCEICGKTATPIYSVIKRGGSGCEWCGGWVVDPTEAAAVMRASGLNPLVPYPGSLKPWKSRCLECEHVVSPRYNHVSRHGGRCKWCVNASKFDAAAESIVYLAAHPTLHAVKIGIANMSGHRLGQHRKRGWEIVITIQVLGEHALKIEKEILDWWRNDLHLPVHLSKHEMPHRGWTETVDSAEVNLPETVRRIRRAAGLLGQ